MCTTARIVFDTVPYFASVTRIRTSRMPQVLMEDIDSSFGSLMAFVVRRAFRCLLVPPPLPCTLSTHFAAVDIQSAAFHKLPAIKQASYLGMVLCTLTLWLSS